MPTHAGDKAEATGTFACQRCGETVRVTKGERIPSCPECGGSSYGQSSPDEEATPGRHDSPPDLKPHKP